MKIDTEHVAEWHKSDTHFFDIEVIVTNLTLTLQSSVFYISNGLSFDFGLLLVGLQLYVQKLKCALHRKLYIAQKG